MDKVGMQPHPHLWKWLLLGLIAIVVTGLAILPRQIGNSKQLRERVTAALSEWSGGKVVLTKPWSVRFFPPLSIRGGFELRGATRLPLVDSITAKDIKISLNVGQLLLGRLSIDGMRLNRPMITLKEGATPSVSPGEIANLLAGTTVGALRLRGGTVQSATGRDVLTDLDASFDAGGDGAVSGFGSLDYRDQKVRFVVDSGELVETATDLSAPFRLRLSGPVTAILDGTASLADGLQFEGTLQAQISDGRRFLQWAGMPVPNGRSLQGLSISGPVHWKDSTLTIDGGSFTLDGNSAVGLLAVKMGERSRIEGTLDFAELALDPYLGGNEPGNAPTSQGAPLAWALLKHLDADLRISAGKIATSALELGRGGFTVNAKQGTVAAEIGELELCGGTAIGRLGFDLTQSKVKASLAGSLSDIAIEPCLKPFALDIPVQGIGSFKTDVSTSGETVGEIVNGLTGDLKIKAQNGAVPIDFTQLLMTDAPLDGEGWSLNNLTPFETLDTDCRLSAGHIWCQKFQMKTQRGLVSGAGDVDMGRQTLNWSLSVSDVPLNTAQLSLESRPRVSIKGSLAQPTIQRTDRPTLDDGSTREPANVAPATPR